jgi:hypothetical protein
MRGGDSQVAGFAGRGKLKVAAGAGVNRRYLGGMCSVLHSRGGRDRGIEEAQGVVVHYLPGDNRNRGRLILLRDTR